jgi:hypothetical protein
VTVYDVADRTAPAVVKQTVFDGGYESSRAVDGVVYVVLQRSVNLPAPNYTDTPIEYVDPPVEYIDTPEGQLAVAKPIRFDPGAPTANRTYETWDEYVARVGDQIVDLSLPHAYTVDADGNTVDIGLVADAESIVRPHTADQRALLTVASLDSGSAPGGPAFDGSVASMVATNGGTVYMTPDALYVATSEGQYTESHNSTGTRIERFTVAGTDVGWQASGVVAGTLINQFAMDEQGGYLRVATHTTSSQLTDGTWITQDDNGMDLAPNDPNGIAIYTPPPKAPPPQGQVFQNRLTRPRGRRSVWIHGGEYWGRLLLALCSQRPLAAPLPLQMTLRRLLLPQS